MDLSSQGGDEPTEHRRKWRLWVMWAIVLAVLSWAILGERSQPSRIGLGVGLLASAIGVWLRTWATVHMRCNNALLQGGPFGRMRHPRYLGTVLMVAGGCAITEGSFSFQAVLVSATVVCMVAFVHLLAARDEEVFLQQKYGARFVNYRSRVPLVGWSCLSEDTPADEAIAWPRFHREEGLWKVMRFVLLRLLLQPGVTAAVLIAVYVVQPYLASR